MIYKLNCELMKIQSPIRITEPFEMNFENGTALCDYEFDKYYLVKSIKAVDGLIEMELEENKQLNNISWIGEEAVSFF